VQKKISYSQYQVSLEYEIPMNEIILNFFDKLKSITKGYASLDYNFIKYQKSDLVKLDVLINKKKIDILSYIISKEKSVFYANFLSKKIKELLPKQLIDINIQVAIGGNIISRSNVKALRKNVIDKCYGGDITRKRKLLEKQKKGKKRMKQIGSINIPQDVFLSLLKMD
jgi:GTP-binding protein LepA